MSLDTYSTADLERELEDRKSEKMRSIADAVRTVYNWGQSATSEEFRTVIRDTGGLSVSWRVVGEDTVVSIEYASQAQMDRCLRRLQ